VIFTLPGGLAAGGRSKRTPAEALVAPQVTVPVTFLASRSRIQRADQTPRRLRRHTASAASGGLQPKYSTHVQSDGSLASHTIGKVYRQTEADATIARNFAGWKRRAGGPALLCAPPLNSPHARQFVLAAGNARFTATFDSARRQSIIGTFVTKRPAEVFGKWGAGCDVCRQHSTLTLTIARRTCLYQEIASEQDGARRLRVDAIPRLTYLQACTDVSPRSQTVAASAGRGSSHPVHLRLRADGQVVELHLAKP